MLISVFRSLAGEERRLETTKDACIEDVHGELCQAFGKLSTFQVGLVSDATQAAFVQGDSTPFKTGGSSFQVLFSYRSRYDDTLRDLPQLKNEAENEERSNPPESALAGGGYVSPQMLTLPETLRCASKACRLHHRCRVWGAALRRACRISTHLSENTARNLHTIVNDYPADVGPCVQTLLQALRGYLRYHDIGSKPKVRRLRRKTKVDMVSFKARLTAHNARVM